MGRHHDHNVDETPAKEQSATDMLWEYVREVFAKI